MARLTLEKVAREVGDAGNATAATSIHLSHRAFSEVSCLRGFQNLDRLDLGFNCLVTLEDLSSCVNLKWLSVMENKLESLKGIEGLQKLTVLNAGKNKLRRMDEVKSVTSLRALILNDNNISSICKLDQLQQLNTLILSRNPIIDIGDSLVKVKSITKLALSHCLIENIGSSLVSCVGLKELRLAHNKITHIPSELAKNVRLQNLDLGNNLIESWSDLKVLSALHNLKNLNLQGNPIAEKDKLAKKVKKIVPALRIFNAKPMETSSKSENLSHNEEPSHEDSSELNTAKKEKRKKSKLSAKNSVEPIIQSMHSDDVILPAPGNIEVPDGKKRKKSKPAMGNDMSSAERRKNDKTLLDDTDRRAKKEVQKKKSVDKEERKVEGIDSTETSFTDLIFSEKDNQEAGLMNRSHEVAPDAKFVGGLVINHVKKKKKSKGTVIGPSALQLLSPAPEVGRGGPSAWDD